MAHALDMRVIAEGVETEQQRDLLAAAGCDFAQGFLYAKPMAIIEFEAFMATYT
jgi:EAL domain-containing protein (putative c-di-GMP-specific phosphodiesterase class I)